MSYLPVRAEARLSLLEAPFYRQRGVSVAILRLDRLHPYISGNKWYKLLPIIRRLERGERPRILSFGGGWSNHIHALAYLGKLFGVETIGVIRGSPDQPRSATLEDATAWGMKLHFLDRERYADKSEERVIDQLVQQYGDVEILPEGGSGVNAVLGCQEIWDLLAECGEWQKPDILACAVGTGGTLAGLIAGAPPGVRLLGVPVLKADLRMSRSIKELLVCAGVNDSGNWELDYDGHWGGYARLPAELAAFATRFEQHQDVPLDPVYTLKLAATVHRRILDGTIVRGSRIILLHTGGLQGRRGMEDRLVRGASAFNGPLTL